MDNNTMLLISYTDLKDLLDMMQRDGLYAEGCEYNLIYDTKLVIMEEIRDNNIRVLHKSVKEG